MAGVEQATPADMSLSARLGRSVEWRFRQTTAQWRALPHFIVIGAQRAGTTSLFGALATHGEIIPSFRKEVHFFELHYRRGLDWYRANFPLERSTGRGRVCGEATPNYLAHPFVPERVAQDLPQVKLIALLRNPIERTHSSWRLRTLEGAEQRSFAEAIHQEAEAGDVEEEALTRTAFGRPAEALMYAYLQKSRYVEHLELWLRHFPREQMHLVRSEDLFAHPDATLREMLRFIGVDASRPPRLPRINAATISKIDATDRAWLADHFAPYNARLEALTGMSFDWE